MEPFEFLERDQFDALTDDEKIAYASRLMDAGFPGDSAENEVQAECLRRYYEVMHWVFPDANEYHRSVRAPAENAVWANAEKMIETLEEGIAAPELSASERERARKLIAKLQPIVDMKRDLSAIPEIPEP